MIRAVDVYNVAFADAVEDNLAAARNRQREVPFAEGALREGTTIFAVRLQNLQHIAACVVENFIGAFARLINECVLSCAAEKRIIARIAPERVVAATAINFICALAAAYRIIFRTAEDYISRVIARDFNSLRARRGVDNFGCGVDCHGRFALIRNSQSL